MIGVHIGLDLEDKAGDFVIGRLHARPNVACSRGGGANVAKALSNSATPKFLSAEPKKTGDR